MILEYGNKRYASEKIDDNHYAIKIPDIKKAGIYQIGIYFGEDFINHIEIKVTSKSASINDDFDDLF